MPDRQDGEAPVLTQDLVRTFGDVRAVDGIDLEIKRGEIFGFLGPNGAGKSTTVRMLTTLLRPTSGSARVAGYDVLRQADDVRRSIGVALQDAAIDPLMTGRELIQLQAVLHGIDRNRARELEGDLLAKVGLVAAADRRVGTYSGGMRRRLDLALALVHTPKVLFLDEPTTGLDPNSRAAIWDEVRRLNREEGATVFLTTQYMEEADQLADRIAIIDWGKIVTEGTPAQLKAQVGDPTLVLTLVDASERQPAATILAEQGQLIETTGAELVVRLPEGPKQVASIVRALDQKGVQVDGLELHNPTLDDVFQHATGRRLEGAEISEGEEAEPAA
jgi:ABC-2 type transport system ATP-binding protein